MKRITWIMGNPFFGEVIPDPKRNSSLRGGTTKQSFMQGSFTIKIASSAEKAFSQ